MEEKRNMEIYMLDLMLKIIKFLTRLIWLACFRGSLLV